MKACTILSLFLAAVFLASASDGVAQGAPRRGPAAKPAEQAAPSASLQKNINGVETGQPVKDGRGDVWSFGPASGAWGGDWRFLRNGQPVFDSGYPEWSGYGSLIVAYDGEIYTLNVGHNNVWRKWDGQKLVPYPWGDPRVVLHKVTNTRTGQQLPDLSQAVLQAQDGDVLISEPGSRDTALTIRRPITIRSSDPKHRWQLTGNHYDGNDHGMVYVDNYQYKGTQPMRVVLEDAVIGPGYMEDMYNTRAGLWFEAADDQGSGEGIDLVLKNVKIVHHVDGLLGGQHLGRKSRLEMESVQFIDGSATDLTHNFYAGALGEIVGRNVRSESTHGPGHLFKSRARKLVLDHASLLQENSQASAILDAAHGGDVTVTNSVLTHGAHSDQQYFAIFYGREAPVRIAGSADSSGYVDRLTMHGNLVVNYVNNQYAGDFIDIALPRAMQDAYAKTRDARYKVEMGPIDISGNVFVGYQMDRVLAKYPHNVLLTFDDIERYVDAQGLSNLRVKASSMKKVPAGFAPGPTADAIVPGGVPADPPAQSAAATPSSPGLPAARSVSTSTASGTLPAAPKAASTVDVTHMIRIGGEGERATIAKAGDGWYGAHAAFVKVALKAGTITIDNATMGGDPIVGVAKSLYVEDRAMLEAPAAPPPPPPVAAPPPPPPVAAGARPNQTVDPSRLVRVGGEGERVTILKAGDGWYGAESTFAKVALKPGATTIDNATMGGDPIVGVVKSLYVEDRALVLSPEPARTAPPSEHPTPAPALRSSAAPLERAGVPDWRAGMMVGEYKHLKTATLKGLVTGGSGTGALTANAFNTWVGMAWKGPVGFLAWPGGHQDGSWNGVVRIDLAVESPHWELVIPASPDAARNQDSDGYYRDGRPASSHSYAYTQYIPALDRVVRLSSTTVYGGGSSGSGKLASFNATTYALDPQGTLPAMPKDLDREAAVVLLDRSDVLLWGTAANATQPFIFSGTGRKWQAYPWSGLQANGGKGAFDSRRHRVLIIGIYDPAHAYTPGAIVVDVDALRAGKATDAATTVERLKGIDDPTRPPWGVVADGIVYDPDDDRYLLTSNDLAGDIWAIDPETFVASRAYSNRSGETIVSPGGGGIKTKFRYVRELGGIVLVFGAEQVWFVATRPLR